LAHAPVVVGQELDAVSHANFPLLPPVAVPVKFLGYDVVTILQTCIELLAAQREGRQLDMVTPWEPVFDHEIISLTEVGGQRARGSDQRSAVSGRRRTAVEDQRSAAVAERVS